MTNKYKVVWSTTAEHDLQYIIEYIAKDSPSNALNILSNIKKSCSNLFILPDRGHLVPELKEFNILQYHELIVDHWRIIYRLAKNQVFVLSVIDSRRNVEDILLDRLVNSGN